MHVIKMATIEQLDEIRERIMDKEAGGLDYEGLVNLLAEMRNDIEIFNQVILREGFY